MKTRWILVCLLFVCGLVVGPFASASVTSDRQSAAVVRQDRAVDWCCLAGLSCCVINGGPGSKQ